MGKVKISELTAASALGKANEFPINEAGTTKKITGDILLGATDHFLEGIRALGSVALGRTLSLGPPSTTLTLIDGRCQMVAVYLNKAATLTGVKFIQLTQGNYTADQNNRIGLYTVVAGVLTLVASSANNGDLWKSTAGVVSVPFSAPYAAESGVYYVGYLYNSSAQTTAPTIAGTTQLSVGAHALDMANGAVLSAYASGADLIASGTNISTLSGTINYVPAFLLLY